MGAGPDARLHKVDDVVRQVVGGGGGSVLVVDDLHRDRAEGPSGHGAGEVASVCRVEPGRPHDDGTVGVSPTHGLLALQLGAPVDVEGMRLRRLGDRFGTGAREHVIGRDVHERGPDARRRLGHVSGPVAIHGQSLTFVFLGCVHVGPRGRIDDDGRSGAFHGGCDRRGVCDVRIAPVAHPMIEVPHGQRRLQATPQLTGGTEHEPHVQRPPCFKGRHQAEFSRYHCTTSGRASARVRCGA